MYEFSKFTEGEYNVQKSIVILSLEEYEIP